MKKILFLLAASCLFLFACNNNKENGKGKNADDYMGNRDRDDDNNTRDRDNDESKPSVIGKWRIVDFEDPEGEEMSAEEKERMTSSTIEFTRDGSYIATSKEPGGESKKEYGTYEYNAGAGTFATIEDKDGKREEFTIKFRGKDRMTLTFDEGKVTMEKD